MSFGTDTKKLTAKQKNSIDRTDPVIAAFETALKEAINGLCTEKGLCGEAQRIPANEFGWIGFGQREYYDYEVPVTGTIRFRVAAYSREDADAQVRVKTAALKEMDAAWLSRHILDNYALRSVTSVDPDGITPPVPAEAPAPTQVYDPSAASEHEGLAMYHRWVRELGAEQIHKGNIATDNINWVLNKLGIEEIDGPGYFTLTVPVAEGVNAVYEIHSDNKERAQQRLAELIAADRERGAVYHGAIRANTVTLPADLDVAALTVRRVAS
jgi:hypothetical protein